MKLSILQPTLIPDLSDIAAINVADIVVVQDSEQWSRKGRSHRAIIRTPEGTQYLNVPIRTEDRKKEIRYIRIDHTENWIDPMLRAIEFNYRNSIYYDFYEPEIRADFESGADFDYLLPFSLHFQKRLFQFLEIKIAADRYFSSEMENYHSNPDKLAKIMNAETYYQELGARHYQRQGINRTDLPFTHPKYRQHFEGFEPGCCLLDLLFQYGPESFKVLDQLK